VDIEIAPERPDTPDAVALIGPFGPYGDDPLSRYYEKTLA
jgi:hypothetical protein